MSGSLFLKKETPAQVFSCKFYEIFKSNVFPERLWVTASEKCFHNEEKCFIYLDERILFPQIMQ